jgi:prefoldin subunit 5
MKKEGVGMEENILVSVEVLKERVSNLEEYRDKQNGALLRLDDRVQGLQTWIMTSAVGAIISAGLMIVSLVLSRIK